MTFSYLGANCPLPPEARIALCGAGLGQIWVPLVHIRLIFTAN
jgi:hypothetical protein